MSDRKTIPVKIYEVLLREQALEEAAKNQEQIVDEKKIMTMMETMEDKTLYEVAN